MKQRYTAVCDTERQEVEADLRTCVRPGTLRCEIKQETDLVSYNNGSVLLHV